MINTIEALQGLYVALGGELSDVANVTIIPEMLTAISTVAAAAASELPAVKTADNGKLLTVVSGKWAKADAPTELPAVTGDDNDKVLTVVNGAWDKAAASGSENFVVTFSGSNGETCDKTLSEVLTAINNGYTIIADISGVTGIQNLPEHFKINCVSHNDNCIGFLGLSIIEGTHKVFHASLKDGYSTVWAA